MTKGRSDRFLHCQFQCSLSLAVTAREAVDKIDQYLIKFFERQGRYSLFTPPLLAIRSKEKKKWHERRIKIKKILKQPCKIILSQNVLHIKMHIKMLEEVAT